MQPNEWIFRIHFSGTRTHLLLPSSPHLHQTHRHFPSPQHPSAQPRLSHDRSCIPAEWTVLLSHNTARGRMSMRLMLLLWKSPEHSSLRKRFQDLVEETKQCRGRETPGPRVVDRQHLQDPLQRALLVTFCVGETTNYPRHRPRAKVGGCDERGAPIALISANVHRLSFVKTAPCPSW